MSFDTPILWLTNTLARLSHPRYVRFFRKRVGYLPNVARPVRYSEMMLWRKLFDHNPIFVTFSDKLATKRRTADLCPTLLLPAVLWTGKDASTIPLEILARPVAIKANHGWGTNVFLPGDQVLPADDVVAINGWIDRAHGERHLEWAYGHVEPTLFVEELILPEDGDELIDLSVHTVDGTPIFIEVITGQLAGNKRKGYFRTDGTRWPRLERQPAPGASAVPALPPDFRLPPCYLDALDHARVLGAGVDYVRIDFIAASGRLYGGEITVYPGSGLNRLAEFALYNSVMSRHWDLSKSWFLTTRQRGFRRLYTQALGRFLKDRSLR